jgi:hypothetical protein
MIADFETSKKQIRHAASKGTVREALVLHDYLERYLPATVLALHNAEIIDTEGTTTKQCDIVIVDPSTPPLFIGPEFHVIPAEWVYGILEVKSSLTGNELKDAVEKIRIAKSLKRTGLLKV